MIDNIRSHIEARVEAAELEKSPFPHLIIENFFPDDVFRRILEYNPFKMNRGEEWLSKSASANVSSNTPYHARKQINFHAGTSFDAPKEQREFWDQMTKCFL